MERLPFALSTCAVLSRVQQWLVQQWLVQQWLVQQWLLQQWLVQQQQQQ